MSAARSLDFWTTAGIAFDLTGAIAVASLALWLWPRRGRLAGAGGAVVAALLVTAGWCSYTTSTLSHRVTSEPTLAGTHTEIRSNVPY
jgi:hypothetical protein